MPWIYLFIAGLFEIGWPLGLKLTQNPEYRVGGWILSGTAIVLSGLFLWLAQKSIPIGTAYAVWTGIGAVGTFLVGIFLFGDDAGFWRICSACLIILGVIGLRLTE